MATSAGAFSTVVMAAQLSWLLWACQNAQPARAVMVALRMMGRIIRFMR